MQQRIVQNQQINNIKIFVRAPGRSNRMVGDVIEFKIPSPNLENRGKGRPDEHKYLSGKYLVTKLRHHFTREKYQIEFECIKDSFKAQMPDRARVESGAPRDASGTQTFGVS